MPYDKVQLLPDGSYPSPLILASLSGPFPSPQLLRTPPQVSVPLKSHSTFPWTRPLQITRCPGSPLSGGPASSEKALSRNLDPCAVSMPCRRGEGLRGVGVWQGRWPLSFLRCLLPSMVTVSCLQARKLWWLVRGRRAPRMGGGEAVLG